MKDEKETREKLLASARQEFLEKGYTGQVSQHLQKCRCDNRSALLLLSG